MKTSGHPTGKCGSGAANGRTTALVCTGLVVLTVIAYGRVWSADFVAFDDNVYVTQNPHVQQGLSADGAAWAFTTTTAANWHPLTWLSLQADYQIYGLNPGGYHVTNLTLHVANAVLLFLVLRRMTGALWRSALVAALFAVHPLHVESVAWVAERKDVLSTLFGVLTLGAYARYAGRPRPIPYLLALAAFALGLAAKPMLVTLPCVLLLLDYWPLGRARAGGWRRWAVLAAEKLPFFALAAASSATTLYAQRAGGAVRALGDLPLSVRVTNALTTYLAYTGKAVWPTRLAIYYPHRGEQLAVWVWLSAAVGLVAATVWAFAQRRGRPYVLVGWLWYVGTLVPVIGLVQVGDQAMADRYTYLPLIGLLVIAAWGLAELAEHTALPRAVPVGASALAVLLCTALTWDQVGTWKDNLSLWEHACAVTEDNVVAEHNLGLELRRRGRFAEAEAHFRTALRLRPGDADTHYHLGVTLSAQEKWQEALPHFAAALKGQPDDAHAYNNMGVAFRRLGQNAQARACYEKALEVDPTHTEARANLGALCLVEDKTDEAIRHLAAAAASNPRHFVAQYNLGLAYAQQRRWAEAAAAYERALALRPDNEAVRRALADARAEASRVPKPGR